MTDTVNMSLDEIIKQNKKNQSNRGGGTMRGRGGQRGRGGRGRGAGGRGRSQSRSRTPNNNGRSRSRSRSRGPRSQSQNRNRSRSQQRRRSVSRSRSRSQVRSITPRGRAGLENQTEMPRLLRSNRGIRGGFQNMKLRRSNSLTNVQGGIQNRLGITNRVNYNARSLAITKRGVSKRGRGFNTRNRYSNVGLRSDQILNEQKLNSNNYIRSQTFTRSRNNSFSSPSQLTVSVANNFAKKRRNSIGNAGYLNRQSLAQLDNQFGGYRTRNGPGSVKSMGSNQSRQSNSSKRSSQSRGRGRARGRGNNRGVGRNFINKQVLNPKLQQAIALIQGKSYGDNTEVPPGVNFTPTPATTKQTLHQRFATA
ncbi:uncharacterized protein DDB_G0287625-like [Leptidea sinapis]|uniref:Uncharacterized protein n=1 Tax=Leptidea sinapis TaxID=189913 RepID=A0A5E4PPT2_9NEOP|nr:uncharacterized protein DDB_G0287625-like [Leptidea sinapis]VVC88016.1 unnamed protein product [Leptidea sinapis]